MRCPSCGFENPEGLKFCNDCGTPLRMLCAQCGFANQPQAKFCGECGGALPAQVRASTAPFLAPHPHTPPSCTPAHLAQKILTSRPALEGERKQVTVLFAAPERSLEWLADREPDDARLLLESVLERTIGAVHPDEGVVNEAVTAGGWRVSAPPIPMWGMRREPASQPCAYSGTAGTTRSART